MLGYKPRMGDYQDQRRRERRLWLAGTVLMAAAPLRFAAAQLTGAPTDVAAPLHAILTPPLWLVQLLGPIDQALRNSGPQVLPALVVLVLLLRLWVNYGRTLFKPVASPSR